MKVKPLFSSVVNVTESFPQQEIEFSALDHLALGHFPLGMLYGFSEPIDAVRFKLSLEKALALNPEMGASVAIRSDGYHVMRTGAGIELVLQTCEEPTPHYNAVGILPIEDYPLARTQLTPADLMESEIPLLGFRITYFEDGGCVLGVRLTHSHVDGKTILQFLMDIADLYRGRPTQPPEGHRGMIEQLSDGEGLHPSDEYPWIEPDAVPSLFEPATQPYVYIQVPFSSTEFERYIDRIKRDAPAVSSSDIIYASAWKAWALSASQPDSDTCHLFSLFDMRAVSDFRLPERYQGNTAIERMLTLTFDEVRSRSTAELAQYFRNTLKPLNAAKLSQDIGYFNRLRRELQVGKDGNYTQFIRRFHINLAAGDGLYGNDIRDLGLDRLRFDSPALWYSAGQDYAGIRGYIEITRIHDGTVFFRYHSLETDSQPFVDALTTLMTGTTRN